MSKTREGPGAVAAARGAGVVELSGATAPYSAKPSRKASHRGPAGRFIGIGKIAKTLAAGERGGTAVEAASWGAALARTAREELR